MQPSVPAALDVRPLSPDRKSVVILAAFDRLDAGESFVLVDDRNPAALCARIEAERLGQGQWTYLQKGPPVWHVRIRRAEAAGAP